ncbi:MAG TPA: DUF885 domain-containing protein [Cyclobacteriaceae bacterium]
MKFSWKKLILGSLLTIVLVVTVFLVNLIWFKPFSIRLFYDKIFVEFAISDPEVVTQMAIPVLYDRTKSDLTDVSDARQWENFNKMKETLATLRSYNFENQSDENKLNTRILEWYLAVQAESEAYFYYDYPVNQMFGVQNNLPSFLENSHKMRDESDIEAYISRLSKFEIKFDQVLEGLHIREDRGIIPPKFMITRVIDEMKGFTGQNESIALEEDPNPVKRNILYTNLNKKISEVEGLTEEQKQEFMTRVEEEIRSTVFPAYQKLIDYFSELYQKANTDDGVWKFSDGENFYRYMLKQNTSLNLDPAEVHAMGLSEVERIKQEMWNILISEGYQDTTQNIGDVIQELNKQERFLFPNDDNGRQAALNEYNLILDEISAGLNDAFDIRPKAGLEVLRVPEFKEEGAAGAYYNRPAMDGSRGGLFYANLRDMKEVVKFGMKTLAYHEGIPGHHFQVAIQSELEGQPIFRTISLFTAFTEGWALYAERLAWELGFYENDPFGNLGRLQAEMFRAVRLVVDTGIHFKKWTREEAIDYMVANTGMTPSGVTTEIERYIVMPGQACAYKIGMMKILELREKAKSELGEKFDLRKFHNVVLKNGAVPLEILEDLIDGYIAESKGA